jgi:hypothetical protein
MIPIHLQYSNGEKLTIQLREGWQDVTTAEYIAMQGKLESELMEWLTGLTSEQLAALDDATAHVLAETLQAFTALPEAESSVDIEAETVGQFETVKSFLNRFYRSNPKTARVMALPYVYGCFLAEKDNDRWSSKASMQLATAAQEFPAADVIPIALAILEQVEKVSQKYEQLARDGEEETDEVGENELAKFGFLPVLHMLSGGDILKHEDIMQQSVRSVYTHLYFLKELAQSQKEAVNG